MDKKEAQKCAALRNRMQTRRSISDEWRARRELHPGRYHRVRQWLRGTPERTQFPRYERGAAVTDIEKLREALAKWLYDREPACGWRTDKGKPASYAIPWADATHQQREDALQDTDAILVGPLAAMAARVEELEAAWGTATYLIDLQDRLKRGEVVRDMAEARGSFNAARAALTRNEGGERV